MIVSTKSNTGTSSRKHVNKLKTIKDKKHNNLVKEENNLLNKLNLCKKTKCGSLQKQYKKQQNLFVKEETKACPKKLSNEKFYECSKVFYENSYYKKLFDEYNKCSDIKCKTIKNKKNNITNKIIFYKISNN